MIKYILPKAKEQLCQKYSTENLRNGIEKGRMMLNKSVNYVKNIQ